MERRTDSSDLGESRNRASTKSGTVDARIQLAAWLRAGRIDRKMSLDDVARVTKIQPRILERLEAGALEGLPAEVFVRGFVRSVAKCVGLDEDEALRRYLACAHAAIPPVARAVVDAMGELAPVTARVAPRVQPRSTAELPVVRPELAAGSLERMPIAELIEPAQVVQTVMLPVTGTLVIERSPAPPQVIAAGQAGQAGEAGEVVAPPSADAASAGPAKKKRARRAGKGRGKRGQLAIGTPSEPSPVVREAAGGLVEATSADPCQISSTVCEQPASEIVDHAPALTDAASSIVASPAVAAAAAARVDAAPAVATAVDVDAAMPVEPADAYAAARVETAHADVAAQVDAAHADAAARVETAYADVAARVEPAHADRVRVEPGHADRVRVEPGHADRVRVEPAHADRVRVEPGHADRVRVEPGHADRVRVEPARVEPAAGEPHADPLALTERARGDDEPIATQTWQPRMPPLPSSASAPWKVSRAGSPGATPTPVTPSLVIDDADPDSAERELEERAARGHDAGHGRRSFLPPILLDREDRSARQGGLTLAVIILLIAATLTLSYLMRRPSSSTGGVTERAVPATLIG